MFNTFQQAIRNSGERGISRLVSWIIYILLQPLPGLYLRQWSKAKNNIWVIEIYVIFKCFFALLTLCFGWFEYLIVEVLLTVFIAETILYNLFFILCSNLAGGPHSPKRSLILGFINYAEVVFSFACFYQSTNAIMYASAQNNSVLNSIDYTYFSVAIGGVLGYGDYNIASDAGKILAIVQCIIFLMFFILFITYNLSLFTSQSNADEEKCRSAPVAKGKETNNK